MKRRRYKKISSNLECSNGMEYILIKRDDGFNVCQVCSKYTANEIVNELNQLSDKIAMLENLLVPKCSTCRYYFDFPTYQLDGYENTLPYCTREEYFITDDNEICEYWWLNIKKLKGVIDE